MSGSQPDQPDGFWGQLLDRFTGLDEYLEALVPEVREIRDEVQAATTQLGEIATAVGGRNVVQRESWQYDFSQEIPANTQPADNFEITEEIDGDGRITQIVVGWPDGTNQLVGVRVRRSSGEKLFPRNEGSDYVAMNDFSEDFRLNADVVDGEEIAVEAVNLDESTDHFVNVVLTVEVES